MFHSVTPMRQLVFEWNAPPTIPTIRKLRTLVYLDFTPVEGNRTSLTLRNFGYGQGEEWAKARTYFDRAWNAVMSSLAKRFSRLAMTAGHALWKYALFCAHSSPSP